MGCFPKREAELGLGGVWLGVWHGGVAECSRWLYLTTGPHRQASITPHLHLVRPRKNWAHLGRVLHDQLVGQPCRPEPQNVPRDQLHRHILNVALVDKCPAAGVKVLKDKAALHLVEFDERMVVVNVCGLR